MSTNISTTKVFLTGFICFLLVSCGSDNSETDEPKEKVTTTVKGIESAEGVSEKEIRIGVSLNLSEDSKTDPSFKDGLTEYFDEVNVDGGIADRSITPVFLDNEGDGLTQVQNVETYVSSNGVLAMIVSDDSSTVATYGSAEDNAMLLVTGSGESRWNETEQGKNVVSVGVDLCNFDVGRKEDANENRNSSERKAYSLGWKAAAVIEESLIASENTGVLTRPAVLAAAQNLYRCQEEDS